MWSMHAEKPDYGLPRQNPLQATPMARIRSTQRSGKSIARLSLSQLFGCSFVDPGKHLPCPGRSYSVSRYLTYSEQLEAANMRCGAHQLLYRLGWMNSISGGHDGMRRPLPLYKTLRYIGINSEPGTRRTRVQEGTSVPKGWGAG